MTLFRNPLAHRRPYTQAEEALFSHAGVEAALAAIRCFPGYAPTPLRERPALARTLGLAKVHIKDESSRFGLGSFKALGGSYAVVLLVRRRVSARLAREMDLDQAHTPDWRSIAGEMTVACATDGNHGRSVAYGARLTGCRCVIFLHAHVSAAREDAIRDLGAEIVRVDGDYDASVAEADRVAKARGWHVVSDTAYEGYTDVPREIMHGYGVMVDEILDDPSLQAERTAAAPFTHVFLQAGVGGMAAAVAARFWQAYGARRPSMVIVEPAAADCLYQSAVHGEPTPATGDIDSTIMAMLACGHVSPNAWSLLKHCGDDFLTIDDADAISAMRAVAAASGDEPFICGESGAAGLGGLIAACRDTETRRRIGLDANSRVLVFATEGATDPRRYRQLLQS